MNLRDRILGPRIGCQCAKCQEAQLRRDRMLLAAAREVLTELKGPRGSLKHLVGGEIVDYIIPAEVMEKLEGELAG